MKTGDTFQVTEAHLDKAIKNKEKDYPQFKICQDCLVSVAASDKFGVEVTTSVGHICEEKDGRDWYSIKTDLIHLFDNEDYSEIRSSLPTTIVIGEVYEGQN